MPNRILRPWVDSEAVNSLSDAAEVFFVRLIQCADDYGRFYGTPLLLKSYLFPLKDKRVADITRWVAECAKAGLIADYEVSGKRFIEIQKFNQRMRLKGASKFPAPPPNDGQMTVARQSYDSQMTVARQSYDSQMTARDERRETGDVKEIPLAGDKEKHTPTKFDFPHSVEEVIELSKDILCGLPCSYEQADAYFTDRVAKDWTPYGQSRMKSRAQICADLKKWLMRDMNTQRERKLKNGDNRRNFENDSSKYDAADDGSNI